MAAAGAETRDGSHFLILGTYLEDGPDLGWRGEALSDKIMDTVGSRLSHSNRSDTESPVKGESIYLSRELC